MAFLVFIGFWYPPPAWKVFPFGQKSSPKDFLSVVVVYAFSQKNPRVRKIRVRNSGAGNGCANFMDTWKNAFFLQENHVRKIPLFWGGGGLGGGWCRFYFYGRADFSEMGAPEPAQNSKCGLIHRRRTNVQQQTCKIDLPFSFYYLFFSFVLLELKPLHDRNCLGQLLVGTVSLTGHSNAISVP